jgi:uncharacterized protein (DUF58 family)
MQTKDLIAKVRKIEIRTRRIVDEMTGGAYHSVFKGKGMEFNEVRDYQAGDDVRAIDWNVTARMGEPFIKKFVEERELMVYVLVDMSASGDFGSTDQRKSELAAELGALLAFSAIRNNDQVALMLFTDQDELHLPPRKGKRHALRLIRELLAFERVSRQTSIRVALETLMKVTHRKAVVFIISDFMDDDYDTALAIANRRHDIVALRIVDRCEERPPSVGYVNLEDAESGETQLFPSFFGRAGKQQAFQNASDEHRRRTTERCRRAGVDLIEVVTGEDYVQPMMQFFRKREKRRR